MATPWLFPQATKDQAEGTCWCTCVSSYSCTRTSSPHGVPATQPAMPPLLIRDSGRGNLKTILTRAVFLMCGRSKVSSQTKTTLPRYWIAMLVLIPHLYPSLLHHVLLGTNPISFYHAAYIQKGDETHPHPWVEDGKFLVRGGKAGACGEPAHHCLIVH